MSDKSKNGVETYAEPPSFGVEEQDKVAWKAWAVLFSCAFTWLSMGTFLVSAGFWATEISADIGGAKESLWLSQTFQVMTAVLAPGFAHLGDVLGRRYIVLVGILFGAVGSFVVASAKSMDIAIFGTALFGILFSVQGNTFAICSEVLPRRHRGTAQLLNQFGSNTGLIIGLIGGGGMVAQNLTSGWRNVFWLSGAMIVLSGCMIFILYKPLPVPNPENLSVLARCKSFHPLGSFLLGCWVIPLMIALIWGGQTYAWSSPRIIALLVVGCVLLIVFVAYEAFVNKRDMFDHRLFAKGRNVPICLAGMFVEGMIYITYNDFYGKVNATLYESRPLLLGTRFAVFNFTQAFGLLLCSFVTYRFRVVKPQLIVGYCAFMAATIGLATATPGSERAAIAYAAIAGFGFSGPIALLVTTAQLAVDGSVVGLITSLLLVCRSLGGAIGTAICGAVYQSKLSQKLTPYVQKAATSAGLPESSVDSFLSQFELENTMDQYINVPGLTTSVLEASTHAAKNAYAESFRYVWIVLCPFLAVALVGVVVLKPVKKDMNQQVDRPIEKSYDGRTEEESPPQKGDASV